jgi:hypothetical protein
MASRVQAPPAASPKPQTKSNQEPFKALLDEARRTSGAPPGLTKKPAAPVTSVGKGAVVTASTAAQAFAPVTGQLVRSQARTAEAVSVQHAATTQQLTTARSHHLATSDQLATTRLQHHETHDHQAATRVVDLIVKELVAEFEPRASPKVGNPLQPLAPTSEVPFPVEARTASSHSVPSSGASTPPTSSPEAKAAQAVALIERIETFVKSQRPAIAMTLNNSLGARVEIEKLGPGRIALRLVGQNGPPTPETVSRIREELRSRGLEVGALSVS